MSTATLIRKSFDGITKVVDGAQGLVEAVVNTTGIEDLQGDVLEVGSWDALCKSMSAGETDYPSVLWSHDWSIPVGRVVHAEELMPGDLRLAKSAKGNPAAGGLRIIAQYNLDTQRGREAYSDVSKGVIKQWSVGFMPDEDGVSHKDGIRRIAKIGMWPEVSNVLVGASPGTRTTATKSAEEILRNPDLPLSDKAAAVEQACIQAVEDGAHAEALAIALEAIRVLTAEHDAYKERLIKAVVERLTPPPPQHSDPENSGEAEELIPSWAKWNVSMAPITRNPL